MLGSRNSTDGLTVLSRHDDELANMPVDGGGKKRDIDLPGRTSKDSVKSKSAPTNAAGRQGGREGVRGEGGVRGKGGRARHLESFSKSYPDVSVLKSDGQENSEHDESWMHTLSRTLMFEASGQIQNFLEGFKRPTGVIRIDRRSLRNSKGWRG